jgi:uncharacterized phiE125 gp8 family phage protein
MPLTLVQTVAPAEQAVLLDDVKHHLRIDHDDDDVYLCTAICAAENYVQEFQRRQLITATYKLYLDRFPCAILVPRPPLQSVTSIEYIDENDVTQTLATTEYQVDTVSEPGRICVAPGKSWPSTRSDRLNAVIVTYLAGYGGVETILDGDRHGIMLLVGDIYEHREAQSEIRVMENALVKRLLWPRRVLTEV